MFTWICPQCGREVPPSYTECPDCAARAAQQGAAAEVPAGAVAPPSGPAQPAGATAPPVVAMPPEAGAPHLPAPPRPSHGLPVWALSIVFAFAFVGLIACVFWGVNYFRDRARGGPLPAAEATPPPKGGKINPLQRYVEVTGVRLLQDAKKKTQAKFVVVNHSNAEIAGLEGAVTIWGRTRKSDEEAEGTFKFKIPTIGAYAAVEMSAPVDTRLKVYELPDWQNVTAEVQISSPQM